MDGSVMKGRLAVIGLDGATFRVLDPLGRAGVMPRLSALRERGAQSVLRSTVPAYTPPAWVSMITGVNPGRHGVLGFLDSTPQEPPRIAHSGLIDSTPIWQFLNHQEIEAGVFNVPMTYPPVEVEGFMVAGGLAAGWTSNEMPNYASSPQIGRVVAEAADGPYPLDTVVSYENDWRSVETVSRVRQVHRLRRRVLEALLERTTPRFLFAVFEGPDRLQHVHYQYLVECSDWYARPEAQTIRDHAFDYFAEVDEAIGSIASWVGVDGHVIVVSDHGAGPWEKTVNLNLLLEEWGFLRLPGVSRLTRMGIVAGAGQRLARRMLPRRLLHVAKARMGKHIAWEQTRAFASQVAEQGIHINEAGALVRGIVDSAEMEGIEQELIERLRALADPHDGGPVVDRVVRRAEVMNGPHTSRAPHLFPFCRDQRYELSDTLAAASPFTDHRDRPWGYHHTDGVFIAAGPSVSPGTFESGLDIVDVLPTVFHMGGLSLPQGLDGRVAVEILSDTAAARPVTPVPGDAHRSRSDEYPFSPEEEAEIEQALRGLGYIE